MDASLAVSALAFVVAVLAALVSVHAVRRDAPMLRLAAVDAAAGSRFLQIVNVGLRPVRLERVAVRPMTWRRRWEPTIPVPFDPIEGHFRPLDPFQPGHAAEVPRIVLQPGEDVLLRVGVMAASDKLGGRGYHIVAEDAAGREYALRALPKTRWGP